MSHPNYSNENKQRGRKLLVLSAGGRVRGQRLGPGPNAKKAHTREVPARGQY